MDQEALVADLKKLLGDLRKRKGPVALLMLFAPDVGLEDTWHVIVSAKGFDAMGRAAAISEVTDLLRQYVGRRHWRKITQTVVLTTNDPFVQGVNAAFAARDSAVNIQSCNISGIEIPRAILLESHKAAA